MTQTILSATNLNYRHQGKRILAQCSLSLVSNEIVALIGSNGAGKTTLLHLLAGLKIPDSGQIHWSLPSQAQWLGYLPDTPPLYPSMSVNEFLRYCAHIRGLKFITKSVNEIAQRCDLVSVMAQRCASLSHGYQQRVGLAQAIIHHPAVILLDEPTNGLDYGQKKALRPLLANLGEQASVLMISHDYEEVIATAHRVYLLQAGQAHEMILPPKNGLWWLTLQDREQATFVFDIAIDEGSYIALDNSRYSLAEIYHLLHEKQITASVQSSYPVEALQARIDNVG